MHPNLRKIPRSGRPRRISDTPAEPSVGIFHIFGRLWPLTALVAMIVLPDVAHACTVCLGDPDSAMAQGVNNGILFLLGCVALVQVGFLALFWSFRSRARRLQRRRDQFSLIEGGAK